MELKFDRARFDAGEMPTRTRDGRKVLHVHDSGLGRDFPLVAWIEGRLGCDEFTADGRYQVYGEGPHDLIHEPQKVRVGLRAEVEALRAEREAMANVLPGVYYMDPPDGGDVSLLKQLQRMSNDAARYRLLRRKFAIISDGEGNAEFCPINLPRPTYIAPNTAIELDTALDRERLGLDGAKRPPTPVGWSDTDWIKHLQEQAEQPHPLAGQHINQGRTGPSAPPSTSFPSATGSLSNEHP